jgi:hypothetical protein
MNNIIREKLIFKIKLDKVQKFKLVWSRAKNEWMKIGYLKKIWSDVHLEEEEEMEDLKIHGCRK